MVGISRFHSSNLSQSLRIFLGGIIQSITPIVLIRIVHLKYIIQSPIKDKKIKKVIFKHFKIIFQPSSLIYKFIISEIINLKRIKMENNYKHRSLAYIKTEDQHSNFYKQYKKQILPRNIFSKDRSSSQKKDGGKRFMKIKTQMNIFLEDKKKKSIYGKRNVRNILKMNRMTDESAPNNIKNINKSMYISNTKDKPQIPNKKISQNVQVEDTEHTLLNIQLVSQKSKINNKQSVKNRFQWLLSKNNSLPIHFTQPSLCKKKEKLMKISCQSPLQIKKTCFNQKFNANFRITVDQIIKLRQQLINGEDQGLQSKRKKKIADMFVKQQQKEETIIIINKNIIEKRQLKIKYQFKKERNFRKEYLMTEKARRKHQQIEGITPWKKLSQEEQEEIF